MVFANYWNILCREDVVFSSSQKHLQIGDPDKVVEMDESKIVKRKCHRVHAVKGAMGLWQYSTGNK